MNIRKRFRHWLCLRFQLVPVERYKATTLEQLEVLDSVLQLRVAEDVHVVSEAFESEAWASTVQGLTTDWGRQFLELHELAVGLKARKPDRFDRAEQLIFLLQGSTSADCELPKEERRIRMEFKDACTKRSMGGRSR